MPGGIVFAPSLTGQDPNTPQVPGAAPAPPAPSDTHRQIQESVQRAVRNVRSATPDAPITREEALIFLQQFGVDVSDPQVQMSIPDLLVPLSDPTQRVNTAMALAAAHPSPITTYQTAYHQLGFSQMDVLGQAGQQGAAPKQPGFAGLGSVFGQVGGELAHGLGFVAKEAAQGYVTSDQGAIKYANGVIANPETGEVFYDPTQGGQPGSALWAHGIQQRWSDTKVSEWRRKLTGMGYLPTTAEKAKGFDAQFLQALRDYHQARYINFGTPIAKTDSMSANATSGMQDLHDIHGQIRNQVVAEFRQVFGGDPTPEELRHWTQFVIHTGMALQQKGISPAGAATEAEMRVENRLTASPEGQAVFENTQLRDAMINAVQATAGRG